MTRVWYCRNCGYEVTSRGRCHACREKLSASALPQLESGPDDDEVGYRLGEWEDSERGRLIQRLNDLAIEHRFEDDELVVAADDESRVDDLVAVVADSVPEAQLADAPPPADAPAADPAVSRAVSLLADAASRLRADPTDMQADADVAEASAAVFTVDRFGALDEDAWLAVGRVTRSLLALLGADEALEDGIRQQASVLAKLLTPASSQGIGVDVSGDGEEEEQTVYELPEWLPEQRAQLGLLLDEAGISYEWDAGELVVPADREAEVEGLFTKVGGEIPGEDVDGGEARYRAVEELFAACARLAGDPSDPERAALVVQWAHESDGPPLLGMDDVDWFRIRTRARSLLSTIEEGGGSDRIRDEANALHALLRSVV